MHAVFVVPRFHPYRGGYENSMLSIARCLVERGHRVTVFTTTAQDLEALWVPGFKTYPPGESTVDGVVIRRFPVSYNKVARRATRILGLAPYWRWKAQYLASGVSRSWITGGIARHRRRYFPRRSPPLQQPDLCRNRGGRASSRSGRSHSLHPSRRRGQYRSERSTTSSLTRSSCCDSASECFA